MIANTERNARILALAGRKSFALIAEELGISRQTVAGVVHRAKQQGHSFPQRRSYQCRPNPLEGLFGEAHPKTKLTDKAVRAIRRSRAPAKALAERFGVHFNYIRRIRQGKARAA